MQYQVTYSPNPLWMGRTQNSSYTFHRAVISAEGESWELPGYVLWASHGRWQEMVETYAEAHIEPGNGLGGDLIARAEATTQQLPEPNRHDIAEFAVKFAELCEANGAPLLESEIL